MELGDFTVVEQLDDGRLLVEPHGRAGVLVVVGRSGREPVAARMGYQPLRHRSVRSPAPPRRRAPATVELTAAHRQEREAELRRRNESRAADAKARDLFVSLLDDTQRADWRRHGRCWVQTPKGPVRLGRLHDLRHRPVSHAGEEWSLCVVPSGPPMPVADVWTNLLLVLAADPASFFRAANVRATQLRPTAPDPPSSMRPGRVDGGAVLGHMVNRGPRGRRFARPRGADAVERLLAGWAETFDAAVAKRQPAIGPGTCFECGEQCTVYGLAEAQSGDPAAPVQCRVCVITGGMRAFAACMARADAESGRTPPPLSESAD